MASRNKKPTPFVVSSPSQLDRACREAIKASRRESAPRRRATTEKFTLEQAFSPFYRSSDLTDQPGDTFDLERGLRSIAFLLHSLCEGGNRDLDGMTASGLSRALENYADYANVVGRCARQLRDRRTG
jgi:hypothetical protein